MQQNAQAYVPRKYMLQEVAEDLRTIINAPDQETAEIYLDKTIHKYEKWTSQLADWL